jgi:predicted GNAT family acetyltransferase
MMSNTQIAITHNPQAQRFETTVDGTTAYLSYQVQGDKLVYDHTIVPSAIGGRGIAGALTKHALDYARKQGKKVAPACSYVASYMQKHPEYADIKA